MTLIDSNSSVLNIHDSMPMFQLPAVDGHLVDSSLLKEPILAIVFTCNHCPYAQAVEPRLIALAEEFESKGVKFVLICSNDAEEYPDDSLEEMKRRAEEHAYPFPYCQDESQEVAKSFGALCTPHCFVFDADCKLRYKGRVDDNWKDESAVTERNLHDALAALVEGKDPPKTEANAIGCSIKWKA